MCTMSWELTNCTATAEWEIMVIHVFLCHCLKQWLLFLVYCRILCRPGLSDGTLNTTQQYDQSGSLRSPRTPLAPHWGSFVVVTAAPFITSPFFYLYQRRDDHWWNSTHFWKFIHVTSFLLPFLISYLLEVEVTINGTYDSRAVCVVPSNHFQQFSMPCVSWILPSLCALWNGTFPAVLF